MRILHVIPAFLPSRHYGGAPGVVHALGQEQVAAGHDVTVLTTDALDGHSRVDSRTDLMDGMNVVRVPTWSNRLAYRHKVFLTSRFTKTVDVASQDIVHLHDYRTLQNLSVARQARTSSVPYILQAHGAGQLDATKVGLKRTFDALLGTRLLRDAAGALALNPDEAKRYRDHGVQPERIWEVPNGIHAEALRDVRPGFLRTRLGLSEKARVVLFLGRLHPSKSVDLLIRALPHVARSHHVHVVVAGPDDGAGGSLRNLAVRLEVQDRFHDIGFLEEDDKARALADADLVAIPSFYGFPLTLLEAMAVGTPVLTTTRHERLDFINGRCGLVASADPAEMGRAIAELLSDESRIDAYSAEARRLVTERFTWPRVAEQVTEIYRQAGGFA